MRQKKSHGGGTEITTTPQMCSEFGIEAEKGVEAALELGFNLLARALDQMHGDMGLMAVGQLERRVLDFGNLALGQEAQSVD